MSYQDFKQSHYEKILYYKDGANVTATVGQYGDGDLNLKVNGKPDATTRGDLATQILLAQVPLLLRPDARDVLVIGLGSGITAGSALAHPVKSLDVVEISPEVMEANRFFSVHNRNALKDPRLKLHIEDGKTFLRTTRRSYDLVISESSNPWIAGVGNLFSLQFYQDVHNRLRPGGVMVQWFHTYEMTDETLRLLLGTFAASFEHVTLWTLTGGDLILLGSREPLDVDFSRSRSRLTEGQVRAELSRLGITSFATLLSLQVMGDRGIRTVAGKGRFNEDEFPILEYEAPKAFFLGQASSLLAAYDERLLPAAGSQLYLARYGQANACR